MKKRCTVRFDDICPTMNWKQFNNAMNLMNEYGLKPLLGVIPDNNDPEQLFDEPNEEFWKLMCRYQENGFTIAMHGYNHVYDSNCKGIVNTGKMSEFAGHSYNEQYLKISKGKKMLEDKGIHTDIFFAPSHSYDKNTLKALKDNGFKYISDGRSKKPYIQEGIICLPCRSFTVPKKTQNGLNIAVCHSSRWDEYPENIIKLKKYLSNNKEYLCDFKEFFEAELGNAFIQKLDEKIYIIWNDYIRRILASNKVLSFIYRKVSR